MKMMKVGNVLVTARKVGGGCSELAPVILILVMLFALGTIIRWLTPVFHWAATADVNGFLDRVMWIVVIGGALYVAARTVPDLVSGRRAEAAFAAHARQVEQERAEREQAEQIERERAEAQAAWEKYQAELAAQREAEQQAWVERQAAEQAEREDTAQIEQAAAPVLDLDRAREERRGA